MNAIDVTTEDRVGTGIDGLDAILGGGLPRNRIYLIEGDPGVGKTTLAMQFLLEGVRRGEPSLYVTLSETAEELTAVAASHGWTLDGIHVHELTPSEEALRPEGHYTLFHPSEVELDETTKGVLAEVERLRPTRVVFDSLSEMRLLAQNALRYRRQILALKQFFVGRRCTVLLLDDRTSRSGDLQLQSIVHGVVSLEQVAPDYGGGRRRLRITKVRGVRFLGGYHDFKILTGGLTVYPRLAPVRHLDDEAARELVSSDIPELDSLLGGGIHRGTSLLVTGAAGAGKSALATQYAVAAARRGETSALFVFDENRSAFFTRAQALSMPVSQHVREGRMHVRQVDPAELAPGEFALAVCDAVHAGARLVVIDTLNGYLTSWADERSLKVQMHDLLSWLNQMGVATILVMVQHGMVDRVMTTPIDLSYLADSVLLLRYFEARGEVRQAISVVKKRTGAHERTIREFRLTSSGIVVGDPLRAFHGVLTGVPRYDGDDAPLLGDAR